MPDRGSNASDSADGSFRQTESPPPRKRPRTSDGPSTTANGNQDSLTLPPLSLSILGVEPLDEFVREVADFVYHTISTRPEATGAQVEVEARIGVMREKISGHRLALPVRTETILQPDYAECRFESNMTPMQHKHFNNLLNSLKTTSDQSSYQASPLKYKHWYLVDSFYPSDNPRERERIRVTRDEKTGHVLECTKKVRLGDLNVYSPKRAADWRVSVNLEIPVPHPIGSASHTRRKDRLSYSHEEFVIDLTQVTSTASAGAHPEILHELELEFARPALLLATAARRGDMNASERERSAFDDLIHAFVNNARILVRNAGDGWQ